MKRRRVQQKPMIGLPILILASNLLSPVAQEPKAPVDRSGEPALVRLMNLLSKQASAKYSISAMSRESSSSPFFESNHFVAVFGGEKKIRLDAANMWGDGRRYISDGKTLLMDYLDLASGIVLKSVEKNLLASDSDLDIKGGYCLITTILFQGADSLEKLASKEAPITESQAGGNNIISIQKSTVGNLKIIYRNQKSGPILIRCEYDNWDKKVADHESFPEWIDEPQKGTLEVELCLHEAKSKVSKYAFDTTPPKGVSVRDERKKESKPAPPIASRWPN